MATGDVNVEAVRPVPFEIIKDGHVLIRTDQGAVLRVKPIVANVLRAENKDPTGSRKYVVQHIVQVILDEPEEGDADDRKSREGAPDEHK